MNLLAKSMFVVSDYLLGTLVIPFHHLTPLSGLKALYPHMIPLFLCAWIGCICGIICNYMIGLALRGSQDYIPNHLNTQLQQELFARAELLFRGRLGWLLLLAPVPYFGVWVMLVAGICKCPPRNYISFAAIGFGVHLLWQLVAAS